nr:T9SS type A sorting domain-containing protein [uncultured Carboxylicivirga sp.]
MKQLLLTVILYVLPASLLLAQYSGGTGSVDDPYKISTKTDLKSLSENSDDMWKSFVLINDISFTETDFEYGGEFYNSAKGFNPIGSLDNKFTGTFDGQGYTIDGVYINSSSDDYVGFFGYIGGGSNTRIENLILTNVNITAKDYVGGLIGECYGNVANCTVTGEISGVSNIGGLIGYQINSTTYQGGIITGCSTHGKVTGSGSYVGGLLGNVSAPYGYINNCFSTADVIGNSEYTGGLIGRFSSNLLSNSYATGNVEGVSYVGGLVGYGRNILNCYAKGVVSGNNRIGGLIGYAYADITNSYATGEVYAVGGYIGGLIGSGGSTLTVKSCYYLSGRGDNDYGTSLTYDEFADESNFTDWNFDKYWTVATIDEIESGKQLPYLSWQTNDTFTIQLTFKDEATNDVISNVEVYTTKEGIIMGNSDKSGVSKLNLTNGNYSFLLTVDEYLNKEINITVADGSISEDVLITPTVKAADSYAGGDGSEENPYQIANLAQLRKLSETQDDWGSYFIQLNDIDATETQYWNYKKGFSPIGISYYDNFYGKYNGLDKTITGIYINRSSEDYTGLFGELGKVNSHPNTVRNIHLINANIRGNNYTGGITGRCRFALVENCSFNGNINGAEECTGGITGYMGSSTISECTVEGKIIGGNYTGGVIGNSYNATSNSIRNSEFSGIVEALGYDYVGGLSGRGFGDIENCHTYCEVKGKSYVGGLIGSYGGSSDYEMKNCSAYGFVSATADYVAGLIGYNSNVTIRYCFAKVEVNNSSTDNNTKTGGIAGHSFSIIEDCFSCGKIISKAGYCGGIVGRNHGDLNNCYTTSEINSTGEYIGQITGYGTYGSSVFHCYYLNNQSNENTYGTPISEKQFANQSTFSEWDFNTIWSIGELPDIADGVRPYLQWQYIGRKQLNLKAEDEDNDDITDEVTLTGGGWCLPGTTVTIKADSENYNFLGWYDNNGNLISADNPYSFVMGSNHMQIKALLEATATDITENELSTVRIYPNPASDFIIVDQLEGKYVSGALYNISGILITNFELSSSTNQYRLNIDTFPNGVYLLKIIAADNSVKICKFYKK